MKEDFKMGKLTLKTDNRNMFTDLSAEPCEHNSNSGLTCLGFDEPADENGIKRRINIDGNVAELYEEGIYCFPETAVLDLNIGFQGIDVAGLERGGASGWMSFDAYFHFLAIGREHFARLKELGKIFGEGYHEFSRLEPGEKPQRGAVDLEAAVKCAKQEEEKHKDIVPEIEEGAQELVQGLGFRNLEVVWSVPFLDFEYGFYCRSQKWDVAYTLGTELVLKLKDYDGTIEEHRHDMRIMDMLCVLEEKKFRSGMTAKIPHQIIFCQEEKKKKEILSDEAYELFKKEEEWRKKQRSE